MPGRSGVEMAVEDRVAHRQVAVAAAVVCDFERVRRARPDELAVEVMAVVWLGECSHWCACKWCTWCTAAPACRIRNLMWSPGTVIDVRRISG